MTRKKRFIDDKGRLFGKVNVLDALALLLAVLLLVLAYARFFSDSFTNLRRAETEIVYQISTKMVRIYTVDSLRVGDKLYDGDEVYLGEIIDIEVSPAVTTVTKTDGAMVQATVENYYDITLTVRGIGSVSDGNYYLDKSLILVINKSLSYHSKYTATSGTIAGIA